MRIVCSTSVFYTQPLEEALAGVRRLGFELVDLLLIEGWAHVDPSGLATDWDAASGRVRALLEGHGLRAAAFNSGLGVPLHERGAEALGQMRTRVDAICRLGGLLGVKVSGLQPPLKLPDRPHNELFDDTLATLLELSERASRAGLTLAVECHARSVFERLPDAVRLLEAGPELRVAYDPTHFVMAGVELRETLPLLQRAAHVHLRDAAPGRMQVRLGEGAVDFDWIVDRLEETGYGGDISIECLQTEQWDVEEDVRRLRGLLERRLG